MSGPIAILIYHLLLPYRVLGKVTLEEGQGSGRGAHRFPLYNPAH